MKYFKTKYRYPDLRKMKYEMCNRKFCAISVTQLIGVTFANWFPSRGLMFAVWRWRDGLWRGRHLWLRCDLLNVPENTCEINEGLRLENYGILNSRFCSLNFVLSCCVCLYTHLTVLTLWISPKRLKKFSFYLAIRVQCLSCKDQQVNIVKEIVSLFIEQCDGRSGV